MYRWINRKMSRTISILLRISEDLGEDSPRERLEDIKEVLEKAGDFEEIRAIIIPILQEMYNFIKSKRYFDVLQYLKALCEEFEIPINIEDVFTSRPIPYTDNESVHIFMRDTQECVDWLLDTQVPDPSSFYKRPFEHPFFDFIERVYQPVYKDKTLVDIFRHLMVYIVRSPHKDEILNILKAEMTYAETSCVSGHLTAMVNSIYGFPGVPQIKGNEFEHEKASVFNFLNKNIDLYEDIGGIGKNITELFKSGKLFVTRNTLKILQEYTANKWFLKNGLVPVEIII